MVKWTDRQCETPPQSAQRATVADDISNAAHQKKFPVISASQVKKYEPSPQIPLNRKGRRRHTQQQLSAPGSVHSFLCSFCLLQSIRLALFSLIPREKTRHSPTKTSTQSPDYRVCHHLMSGPPTSQETSSSQHQQASITQPTATSNPVSKSASPAVTQEPRLNYAQV